MSARRDACRAEATAGPVGLAERIHALDILRGFALFGMILVHFHQKMRLDAGGIEGLIAWGVYLLVEQKAWGTFAFLFGVGFAVLLRRLEARQAPVVATYLRRMAALAGFGVIADVGFGFHILFAYACWGVVLLLIRRWSTRTLLVTAAIAAVARPAAAELTAWWAWWMHAPPAASLTAGLSRAVEAAAVQGDYGALLAARWALFRATPAGWRDLLPDTSFVLFLVGFLAVRHRVLDEPLRHARTIAGWMIFGLVSWVLAWTVLSLIPELPAPGARWPLQAGLDLFQDQWLCFVYIGALVLLLAKRPAWVGRLSPIGQAGRMALTNYLLQAAVLDAVSSGYGLGLKLRPFAYVPAALSLFGVEVLLSAAWLSRFRFGPLEWIWRLITYWRWQRLARTSDLLSVRRRSPGSAS